MRSNMLSFRDIRQLVKQKKALFVIEGRKLFSEAPPEQIRQVILTDRFAREYPELLAKIPAGADVMTGVGEERFAQISDTKSPQGILTVLSFGGQEKAAELEGDGLYLLLEHLQDPGNAGTILREQGLRAEALWPDVDEGLDEDMLIEAVNASRFVIGDPLFRTVLRNPETKLIPFPHEGYSGRIFRKDIPVFAGKAFEPETLFRDVL